MQLITKPQLATTAAASVQVPGPMCPYCRGDESKPCSCRPKITDESSKEFQNTFQNFKKAA
jgi:hypothetical protein